MKNICFVTTVSSTLKAFVIDTAKYLHDYGGYNITFICDNDDEFAKSLPKYIRYIPVPMKRGISISGIKAIFKIYSIFKAEEFVLVQYSTPNASFYASIASKMAKIPVRLYCQWGIVYVSFKGLKRRIFKLIEKTICSLSTWIEPDSLGNLRFCYKEGLYTDKKSSVVWNGSASGVNLKKFDVEKKQQWRDEIRSLYNIKNTDYILGYVGRITGEKGINVLLKAIKTVFTNYPDTKLIIVGPKDKSDSFDNDLYEWSKTEPRIIYSGFTDSVEKYLSAMDVFVLPSYREGFGSVVIEAEAMGIPVIVTDIPGPTDAMIDGKTGLVVKKGDVKSLEQAIIMLYENRELASNFSKEGHQFAINKFDNEKLKQYILEDRNRLLRGIQDEQ